MSVGNPTLSLESYTPDVVEEETEEDLEDEINNGKVEDDCNSIGGLRDRLYLRVALLRVYPFPPFTDGIYSTKKLQS